MKNAAYKKQAATLKSGIRWLEKERRTLRPQKNCLPEQPFDLHLLNYSSLFRRSRKLYLEQGGKFLATLVSSPRTLSSPILMEPRIEYSPVERELVWSAMDPIESKNPARLLDLRTYCTSLYHEQNHRILWDFLPGAPAHAQGLRRFLNFAESLVVTLDMALGDDLGPKMASLFYLAGVTYDPGTTVRKELSKKRDYRNYLQAALYATYLNLEFYSPQDIPQAIDALFPNLGNYAERAAKRSCNLDQAFVHQTNPRWQKKHYSELVQRFAIESEKSGKNILDLPSDPLDNREQYLIAEKVFEQMGL